MDELDDLMTELRAGAQRDDASEPITAPRRRLPGRRVLVTGGAGVLALLLTAGLAAQFFPGGASPMATPAPLPTHTTVAVDPNPADMFSTPTPLQWQPVIEQLDRRRGLAFIKRDQWMLMQVDALESPALASDQALINSLKDEGAYVRSFPLRVLSVTEQYVTVGERHPRAMLTVTDVLGAYDIVDAQGKVLRHVPARGERTWNVALQSTLASGWLYSSSVSAVSR